MLIIITVGLVLLGLILSTIRLIVGKDIESRVVAIDVITTITSGLIIIFAFIEKDSLFLDVALIYAILSFAAVIAIARYLEGGI